MSDPSKGKMRDLVSNSLKYREAWRPFTPLILEEHYEAFFDPVPHSLFMILSFLVNQTIASKVPTAVHIDRKANELFKHKGKPILKYLPKLFNKIIRIPLKLVPNGLVVHIWSGPARGLKWIVGAHTHGCWIGNYETKTAWAFYNAIPVDGVVFDVGANVGYYSLIAAKKVRQKGSVWAFEPAQGNADLLNSIKQLNHLDNITLLATAVSDYNGTGQFTLNATGAHGKLSDQGSYTVEVRTIDSLIEEKSLPTPNCLKIDVEGAEEQVLKGALGTLKTHRPTIFLAVHGEIMRSTCMDLLSNIGYSIVELDSRYQLLAT